MTANTVAQLVSTGLLTVAAFFLVNPFEVWMPDMAYMVVLALAVAVFGALSIFVIMEQEGDEREHAHRETAGRAAFLAGSAVLILGIILQTLEHQLDPWLVWSLLAMIIAKITLRIWSASYR